MISENFDGEWIARIIERFGFRTSRGSTSRGGQRALLQLKRDMEQGQPAGFAVDGPRGPARRGSARRRLAREADGQSRRAVSHGGVELLEPRRAGTARRFRGRSRQSRSPSAAPIDVPRMPTTNGVEAKRVELEQALLAPGAARSTRLLTQSPIPKP